MDFIRIFWIALFLNKGDAVTLQEIADSLGAVDSMLKDFKEKQSFAQQTSVSNLKEELKRYIDSQVTTYNSDGTKFYDRHEPHLHHVVQALVAEKKFTRVLQKRIHSLEKDKRLKDNQILSLIEGVNRNTELLRELTNTVRQERLDNENRMNTSFDTILGIKTSLETVVGDLQNELRIHVENNELPGNKIAFTARVEWGRSIQDLSPGETVVFRQIDLNKGEAYSSKSGQFKAPVKGLYVFYLHITGSNNRALEIALHKNGKNIILMYVNGPGHATDGGMVTTELNSGDVVNVVKHGNYGDKPFYIHNGFSYFSGFLLSEL